MPDTESGKRVTGFGRGAPSGAARQREEGAIYCADAPHHGGITSAELRVAQKGRGGRSRRRDMGAVRYGTGEPVEGSPRTYPSGRVSRAAVKESVYPKGGWPAAAIGHRDAGG